MSRHMSTFAVAKYLLGQNFCDFQNEQLSRSIWVNELGKVAPIGAWAR
jgi:hypothetical protein